jgi:formylglycine-generating enzyme required for sulfatase activity
MPAVWRADLVRVLADLPPERVAGAAELLGFETPVEVRAEATTPAALPIEPAPVAPVAPEAPAAWPVPFWRLDEMTFTEDPEHIAVPVARPAGLTDDDLRSPGRSLFDTPPAPPLAPWSRLWPALREALQAPGEGRDPDVGALLRAWGRGDVVRRVPRVPRRAWAGRASVWVDRSPRLVPFWSDQDDVCRRLRKVCGRTGLDLRILDARAQARALARRGDLSAGFRPSEGTPVLVLGDLGAYASEGEQAAWRVTARRLGDAGVRVAALVPCPAARWDRRAARAWAAVPWERGRTSGALGGEPAARKERAERLLRLASPALLVQPGLLRALRQLLPAWQADAGTEADAWAHEGVRAADATGLVLHAEAAERWRTELAAGADADLLARVSEAIGRWHGALPQELLRAETLVWHALFPGAATPGKLADAQGFAHRLAATARAGESDPAFAAGVRRYGRALLAAVPESAYEVFPDLRIVWAAAFQGVSGVAVPPGVDPQALSAELGATGAPRWWAVRQVGGRLLLSPSPDGAWPSQETGPGSPMAWLLAARPEVTVRSGPGGARAQVVLAGGREIALPVGESVALRTDRCTAVLKPFHKEGWAKAMGRDRFGLWGEAEVKGVAVRFRWIPPGRFRMGSPESEAGRWDDEGPQHMVTWTRGRWLADAPVTQALWQAVMGKNPSQFASPERPVEQVSWEDCQTFLRGLDALVPGLDARLPSEAEWEHACRAGTETATWVGDLEIRGENDAPILDAIAWYGGNCGVDFELENGSDRSKWPNKQYDHATGGSHPVRRRAPNPLGLFDMLGNVYEWCLDALEYGEGYAAGDVVDPPASRTGSYRVIRGGSWDSYAGFVRAASRGAGAPGGRAGRLGLRLARGQSPTRGAEPAGPGAQRVPGGRDAGRGPGPAPARDAPAPTGGKKRKKKR